MKLRELKLREKMLHQCKIGEFGISKDNYKFIVESLNGENVNIRFLHNSQSKTVTVKQIKSNLVTTSKRRTKTVKLVGFKVRNGFKGNLLALDQSTSCTGYAVYINGELVDYGALTSSKKETHQKIRSICSKIEDLIKDYAISVVAIEDIYLDQSKLDVYKVLANLLGAIIDTTLRLGARYKLVSATEWKSHFGILKHREYGKELAIAEVKKLLGKVVKEDVAEAVLIGKYYCEVN